MGSLHESQRCRLCGEETEEKEDIFTIYIQVGEGCTISASVAAEQLFRLKLSKASPLPRHLCDWCKKALQQAALLLKKVENGQRNLATLLAESGYRGRGRPRKDTTATPPNSKPSNLELVGSQVGKRRVKLPKRFEETVHSLNLKEDVKADGGDLEETGEDAGEDFTVTIDLTESKASQSNPVIAEINSILNQFDHQQSDQRKKCTVGVTSDLACEVCDQTFVKEKELGEHVQSAHGQIMYKCEVASCNALLKSKQELASHQQSFGHQEFIILVIGAPADSLIAEHTSDRSSFCDADFVSNSTLATHKIEAHIKEEAAGDGSTKVFSCPEVDCGRHFAAASSLTYHRFAVHNAQVHACTYEGCGKTFKIRNLLTRHLKTHTSERTFACDKCDKAFKTQSNLSSHKTVHMDESKFFCDECGQQFKFRTSLVSHMRWHNGAKPFKCPYCQKSFNQNGNLQEHVRIHTGEKPFKCDLCPRKFTTSSQHKLHVKRHLGLKQFKCEYCSKAFLNKDTFKTHIRRHKGEKPYPCKLCKKSFAESWALTKHMRFHTGLQPYLCKQCGKKFSDSSNLAKHKKIHDENGEGVTKEIWNIVRDGAEEIVDEKGEGGLEQVIYIAYDESSTGGGEGMKSSLVKLRGSGIAVEEVARSETSTNQNAIDSVAQVGEGTDTDESSIQATETLGRKRSNTMEEGVSKDMAVGKTSKERQEVNLATKDGGEVRLVGQPSLVIDPLTFAAEYLKDIPS